MLKQTMLTRISAALSRATPDEAPELLPPFSFRTPAGAEGLSGEFCAELEKVGGRARRVRTCEEVLAGLEELPALEGDAPVAVSDGELLREFGVRERIVSAGYRVIPPFAEYAAARRAGAEAGRGGKDAAGLFDSYKRELSCARVGVTSADYGIAGTGTLVLVSTKERHRLISLLPPVHFCLLDSRRIVASLPDLLARVQADAYDGGPPPPAMTFITGPSRTADVEHTITLGVHGPHALHLFLYERPGESGGVSPEPFIEEV